MMVQSLDRSQGRSQDRAGGVAAGAASNHGTFTGNRALQIEEPLIFEMGQPGRCGSLLRAIDHDPRPTLPPYGRAPRRSVQRGYRNRRLVGTPAARGRVRRLQLPPQHRWNT